MKFAAMILLLAAIFAQSANAQSKDIRDTLSKSTLALYEGKQVCEWKEVPVFFGIMDLQWGCEFKSRFICTAVIVGISDRGYTGLTVGHCFDWDDLAQDINYYVSDNVAEKPALRKIDIFKFENDDRYDYGVFTFRSMKRYPIIEIDESSLTPEIGAHILNCNFALGITKQMAEGVVISNQVSGEESYEAPHLRRRYLTEIPSGPGASGSPIVDMTSHKLVGILEGHFRGTTMGTVIVPIGINFVNFMDDDSAGLKPQPEGPKPAPIVVEKEAPAPPQHWYTRVWSYIKHLFGR